MTLSWQIAALFCGSYLLGSIPFGLIIAKLKGVDIRKQGSGNVGATNAGRILGRRWGILVLALDMAKGAAASLAAGQLLAAGHPPIALSPPYPDLIRLGTGVCCVVGSIAPVYLRFRGGKGVATGMGVILGIYPYLTLPAIASVMVWAAVVKASGYISLGSIVAACTLPPMFLLACILRNWSIAEHYPLLALTIVVAAVVVFRHGSNIGRLLSGTENKSRGA